MKLVIYGAQGYALGVYEALKMLYPQRVIPCFLVSKMDNNAEILGNIPVMELAIFSTNMEPEEKEQVEVLIATPENVHSEIEESLENYGFHYYRRLDSGMWAELMKLYHIKLGRFLPISALPGGYHMPFLRIYMAKSHKDRPLKTQIELPDYMYPIQVGTVNSERRIADLTDNQGDNISEKNVNYSELTGLYWIWRNKLMVQGTQEGEQRQYYGLAQYRRILELSNHDLLRLVDNDVDVVLPYPMPYEPNIHAHHKRYIKDEDWEAVLQVIKKLQPEYAEAFPDILDQQFLYNYNLILAKKTVLREYCNWLFPILEQVELVSVPKACDRSDRYIGYIAESLETLYFIKNRDVLNITHTGCRMQV